MVNRTDCKIRKNHDLFELLDEVQGAGEKQGTVKNSPATAHCSGIPPLRKKKFYKMSVTKLTEMCARGILHAIRTSGRQSLLRRISATTTTVLVPIQGLSSTETYLLPLQRSLNRCTRPPWSDSACAKHNRING